MSEMGILAALREISPVFRRINASPRIRERDLPFSAHRRFIHSRIFFLCSPCGRSVLHFPSIGGEFNSTNHSTSLTIILFRGCAYLLGCMQIAEIESSISRSGFSTPRRPSVVGKSSFGRAWRMSASPSATSTRRWPSWPPSTPSRTPN